MSEKIEVADVFKHLPKMAAEECCGPQGCGVKSKESKETQTEEKNHEEQSND